MEGMDKSRELPVVAQDEWLKPNEADMERRYERYLSRLEEIRRRCGSLVDYANGYLYFGFQYDAQMQGGGFVSGCRGHRMFICSAISTGGSGLSIG